MKKLITANDVREAQARGLKTIAFVLKESIVTPEAREVADQLEITLVEEGAGPVATDHTPPRSERQRILEEIISQLPEGKFTESLMAPSSPKTGCGQTIPSAKGAKFVYLLTAV